MAIGGGMMKGHLYNNGNRGRSYGLMVLVAFAFAIFGVMTIHKLREKRIFNLVIKEKDRELITLHFLLQKEREYGKETKLKLEDMKAKMRTLRMQKMDLDRQISDMQSTIFSLKDEQIMIESALEEKQNETKQFRENYADTDETNQAKSQSEILKQKEAEIEDLKSRLDFQVKVWSGRADDPANSTAKVSTTNSDETEVSQSNEDSGKFHEATNGGNNSTQDTNISRKEYAHNMREDERENGQVIGERSQVTGEEEPKKLEDFQEDGLENHTTNGGELRIGSTGHKKVETTANDQPGNDSNSVADDNQEKGVNSKGVIKLQLRENVHAGGFMFRGRGKLGSIRKITEKRQGITAKSMDTIETSRSVGFASTRATTVVERISEREREEKPKPFDQKQDIGVDLTRRSDSNHLPQGSGLKFEIVEQDGSEHGKGKENLGENSSDNNINPREDRQRGANMSRNFHMSEQVPVKLTTVHPNAHRT